MTETAGWLSLGLGVVQQLQSGLASGSNGVFVESDSLSYHLGNFPTNAPESTLVAGTVHIQRGSFPVGASIAAVDEAYATISVTGHFAVGGDKPPELANVRLWCSHQEGDWGTSSRESELHFKASGMPTPIGTAEDPKLEYQCRLELKVPQADNVILHWRQLITMHGLVEAEAPHFEYGQCHAYPNYPYGLAVTYEPALHGKAAS